MATAAAAIVAKAQRDVVSHFMQCNAINSGSAVSWVPDRRIQRRMLERLIRRKVIVETGSETYFLDLPAYDRWSRSRRKRAVMMVGGVAALGALFAALA